MLALDETTERCLALANALLKAGHITLDDHETLLAAADFASQIEAYRVTNAALEKRLTHFREVAAWPERPQRNCDRYANFDAAALAYSDAAPSQTFAEWLFAKAN